MSDEHSTLGLIRQRDASDDVVPALERVKAALLAAQQVVLSVHGKNGINLIDAVQGMETALDDVRFELERDDRDGLAASRRAWRDETLSAGQMG